ncbi:MAG: hypothetical protein WCL71_11855 [Deltaproteobacteria bacterium]
MAVLLYNYKIYLWYTRKDESYVTRHAGIPDIQKMILAGFLNSGYFSMALLEYMKASGIQQAEWLAKIQHLSEQQGFADGKKLLKRDNIYKKITELMAGL